MFNQMIKKSIHKSQHCNRNWDLSKSIPQEDIDLITESATQCPVKQNLNFESFSFCIEFFSSVSY